MKSLSVTIQMKAAEQYFPVARFACTRSFRYILIFFLSSVNSVCFLQC